MNRITSEMGIKKGGDKPPPDVIKSNQTVEVVSCFL